MIARTEHPATENATHRAALVIAATSLAYFLVILDTTAKNVALPDLGRDLQASVTGLQWVVSSYLLAFSSLLLTGGVLCDRLGGKRVFVTGFAVFGVGSLVSALAGSVSVLIIAQVIAGVGAALVTPASLAVLIASFPSPADRGKALGTWAAIAGAGTASGPLIGGSLTSLWSWRAVFMLNVPIVFGAIAVALKAVAHLPAARSRHFNPLAQLLAVLSLGLVAYGVIRAGDVSWQDTKVVSALLIGLLCGAALVSVERRSREPMLPMSVYTAPQPLVVTLMGIALNFCTIGVMFLLALYLEEVRGYSAVMTGAAELPMTLLCVILPRWAGRAIARRGPYEPLVWGMTALSAGSALLVLTGMTKSYWAFLPGLLVLGAGIAFAVPAVSGAAVSGVAPALAGSASATLSAARQMGGLFGVSILGSVVAGDIGAHAVKAFALVALVVLLVLLGGLLVVRRSQGHHGSAA